MNNCLSLKDIRLISQCSYWLVAYCHSILFAFYHHILCDALFLQFPSTKTLSLGTWSQNRTHGAVSGMTWSVAMDLNLTWKSMSSKPGFLGCSTGWDFKKNQQSLSQDLILFTWILSLKRSESSRRIVFMNLYYLFQYSCLLFTLCSCWFI